MSIWRLGTHPDSSWRCANTSAPLTESKGLKLHQDPQIFVHAGRQSEPRRPTLGSRPGNCGPTGGPAPAPLLGGGGCDTSLGLRVCVLSRRRCSQEGVGGTSPAVAGRIHQAFVQPSSAFRPFHLSLLPSIKRVPSHLHQAPRQRFTHPPCQAAAPRVSAHVGACACVTQQGSGGSRHTGIVTCCGNSNTGAAGSFSQTILGETGGQKVARA